MRCTHAACAMPVERSATETDMRLGRALLSSGTRDYLAIRADEWYGVRRSDGGALYGSEGYSHEDLVEMLCNLTADYDGTPISFGVPRALWGWHVLEILEYP